MTATRQVNAEITGAADAMKRGRDLHDAIAEAAEAPKPAPVFEPSPGLVELHAKAKRLEREQNHANIFNPRLGMRLQQARQAASARWQAEVRAFELANPSTAPEPESEAS